MAIINVELNVFWVAEIDNAHLEASLSNFNPNDTDGSTYRSGGNGFI